MSESLLTLAPSDNEDVNTLAQSSVLTEETLCDRIFGTKISEFTIKRKMPLVSAFLSGTIVFPCETSLHRYESSKRDKSENGGSDAILQSTVPILSAFKRKAPFIMIYRLDQHLSKEEFCRVYYKMLKGNDTRFLLEFVENGRIKHKVTILNSGSSPCADAMYKNTNLRFLGTKGGSSTFRSHRIDLVVSDPSFQRVDAGLIFASFHSAGSGQVIEVADTNEGKVSEDTLVVACMLLVLREQETRKNGL